MLFRSFVFHDEDEKWFEDNDLRTIFFCKGALETVKKFGWPPDIIHCSGWMTGLIPMYIKEGYKREPVFNHSKIIFTIGSTTFKEKLGKEFLQKARINTNIKEKDLEIFKDGTNIAMLRCGATYADAITFGAEKVDKKLTAEFSKVRGKKIIAYNENSDLTEYLDLYNELATK